MSSFWWGFLIGSSVGLLVGAVVVLGFVAKAAAEVMGRAFGYR